MCSTRGNRALVVATSTNGCDSADTGSFSLTGQITYCLHAASSQGDDSKLRLTEPPFDEHAFLQPYWMPSLHSISRQQEGVRALLQADIRNI